MNTFAPQPITIFAGIILMIGLGCNSSETSQYPILKDKMSTHEAPQVEKKPKELSIHGDTRIDNYYWLNDREDEQVIDYLNRENEYTQNMLSHTNDMQTELYDEIVGRIKKDDASVPFEYDGYWYYRRYEKGNEYPFYCRKKESLDGEEEVMLDVNALAADYAYYAVGGRTVSTNNTLLAYGEDTLSRRIYNIRFKNLETGEMLDDLIENTTGRAVWANDNKTVFYVRKDEALRSYKIFRHTLGTDASTDVEIHHESDETYGCYVYKSKSKKYVIIGSYATLANAYKYVDADNPTNDFVQFIPREDEHEYFLSEFDGKFYVVTNWKAENFRLMEADPANPAKENWKEIIPHRSDVLIQNLEIFSKYLVLQERKEGLTQLRIRPWEGGSDRYVKFNDPAYAAGLSTNRSFDTDWLRYSYSSMSTPNSTFDYNMKSGDQKLLKQTEVLGEFDANDYVVERLSAPSRDGVQVPISLVYKKGTAKDGSSPLLLYGYGSYGATIDPRFSSVRLSLLNRGFIFAIAHIRGSQVMGRNWYNEGKMLKKKNTFTDFIDCAEHLIDQKYTSKEKLFAQGGSAGGLLMGAVVNMRPDLWKGVVAAVPFVDVVTTMLDESIPLTTGEFDEWGNPKDEAYYNYIKSYSPYDNVEAKDYPAMLVTTGLHDSQVQYWEPAKWVAKLRELKTDSNVLLLDCDMEVGHGGASGRFERLKKTAMEYAFFLDQLKQTELSN